MCNYVRALQFAIHNEEDLLLLDSSDEQLWKVSNARGEEGLVPPLAVVIPGPTKEATDAALRSVQPSSRPAVCYHV